MLKLYDYQLKAVTEIRSLYAQGIKKVLLQSPTASGKTVMFSFIASESSKKGKKILILTHREELLKQGSNTLTEFGIHSQLITSKTKNPINSPVSVSMVLTLKNRLKNPIWLKWFNDLDLIVADESHRVEFHEIMIIAKCFLLGVTATCKRKGKQPQLSSEYERMVEVMDVQELINIKKLIPARYFEIPVDVSNVPLDSTGEYDSNALFQRFNKTEVYGGIIDNWLKICPNLTTIVFCCNIEHCIETARSFNEAGIKAKFVTSSVSKPKLKGKELSDKVLFERKTKEYENYLQGYELYSGDREDVVNEWKRGEFHVLINCGIFCEGFDWKPTMVNILAVATTSLNKYLQMCGRTSRIFPGKEFFYLLDFGQNVQRLGTYHQQREWSLSHMISKNEGIASVKTCPKCQALVIASSRYCKYCGWEFEKTKEEKIAELVEVNYAQHIPQKLNFSKMTFEELDEYARQRGYKKGFIYRQVYLAFGEQGLKDYAKKHGFHHSWFDHQIKIYKK
jgi:superfamily II DNA or RNA helicase